MAVHSVAAEVAEAASAAVEEASAAAAAVADLVEDTTAVDSVADITTDPHIIITIIILVSGDRDFGITARTITVAEDVLDSF